jgi:DNA-binding FadR family transcriptional regulator
MVKKVLKQKTVVQQVMEEIKDLIVQGDYRINDRIPTESQLSERFGVGRSTVREAIKIFQYLGVLETRISKGTFVCDNSKISNEALTWSILLGKRDLFELVELRAVIERAGLERLIKDYHFSPESVYTLVTKLEDLLFQMPHASKESLVEADYHFHEGIIQASKNSIFIDMYTTLQAFMREEIKKCIEIVDDFDQLYNEHYNILDSIKQNDPEKGLKALDYHIEQIKIRLRKALEA